jgi:hypothetical protein
VQRVDNTEWEKLIFAAQYELQRIEQRADQLKQAILVFRKKQKAGEPPILNLRAARAK